MKTRTKTKLAAAALALCIAAPAVAQSRRGHHAAPAMRNNYVAPRTVQRFHHSRPVVHCGVGRWVDNVWTCPETATEASLREIAEAQREMARQQREQLETMRLQQQNQAAARPQVIVIQPAGNSNVGARSAMASQPIRPAWAGLSSVPADEKIYRRQDSKGVVHFSNVQ